jgi:hypothetical protein
MNKTLPFTFQGSNLLVLVDWVQGWFMTASGLVGFLNALETVTPAGLPVP